MQLHIRQYLITIGDRRGKSQSISSTKAQHAEKESDKNFGLRNFKYIEVIKDAVEKECPGVVSCANILILSGRDGILMVSH